MGYQLLIVAGKWTFQHKLFKCVFPCYTKVTKIEMQY